MTIIVPFDGHFDGVEPNGIAAGWALGGAGKTRLRIMVDGIETGIDTADVPRPDLRAAGFSDITCAFRFALPIACHDGKPHVAEVRFADTDGVLPGSPVTFQLSKVAVVNQPVPGGAGHFDAIERRGYAAGWARIHDSTEKAMLNVTIDGRPEGQVSANQFRADLDGGGALDSTAAFWFRIPDTYRDGLRHEITIAFQDGTELEGSPRTFQFAARAPTLSRVVRNWLPNADFTAWPYGIVVRPGASLVETAAEWLFDTPSGTTPAVSISAAEPADLGMEKGRYALRIIAGETGGAGEYRLIVSIDALPKEIAHGVLSIGVRRPIHADDAALHIASIHLGRRQDEHIETLAPVIGRLRPRGTRRLTRLPLVTDGDELPVVTGGGCYVLIIALSGSGEMLLFDPVASSFPAPTPYSAMDGEFEDSNIRAQLERLILAPEWSAGKSPVSSNTPRLITPTQRARAVSGTPFVQIVVPVFNAGDDVEDMIESVLNATDSPFELLLRDDASGGFTQDRIARLAERDPRVRYHCSPVNLGYTQTVNIGLQETVSTFVVVLNSDTIVTSGWLDRMVAVMMESDWTGAVGPLSNAASWQSIPQTKDSHGAWVVNALPPGWMPADMAALVAGLGQGQAPAFPLLNGFCTLFRRAALEAVGYLDGASFPRGYGEENDLCLRLGEAGYALRVAADAYVYHKKSRSFGHDQRRELSQAGNAALRAKHPQVRIVDLEDAMRSDPILSRLRAEVTRRIAGMVPLVQD